MRPAVGPGRRPTGSTPIRRTPFPFCGKLRKTQHGVGAIATPPMSGSEQVKTVIEWQEGARSSLFRGRPFSVVQPTISHP